MHSYIAFSRIHCRSHKTHAMPLDIQIKIYRRHIHLLRSNFHTHSSKPLINLHLKGSFTFSFGVSMSLATLIPILITSPFFNDNFFLSTTSCHASTTLPTLLLLKVHFSFIDAKSRQRCISCLYIFTQDHIACGSIPC